RTHTSPSCRINRVTAERDIRLKVGRYRLRARHDERHPFHRVRSGRPVQDRSIAKARANASDSRGRSDAVEKTLCLHQARGLGFCKQALSGPKTVLGSGDLAQIHTSRSATSRNPEAIRMAYVPAQLLDPAAKRGDRVQGDAGVAAAFFVPLNAGRLHAGSNAREARSAGGRDVAGLYFR